MQMHHTKKIDGLCRYKLCYTLNNSSLTTITSKLIRIEFELQRQQKNHNITPLIYIFNVTFSPGSN